MTILYTILFILGAISGRTVIVGARAGQIERRAILVIIGTLSNLLTLSLIIWGFATLEWPWATAVTVIGLTSTAVVTNSNQERWNRLSLLLNMQVTIGSGYLWIAHWPF
jgi:hypothetical protein